MVLLFSAVAAARCPETRATDVVVAVVNEDANPDYLERPSKPAFHVFSPVRLDADGRGPRDAAVPRVAAGACPHEVEYELFLGRRLGCPVSAGVVLGTPRAVGEGEVTTARTWSEIADPNRPAGPDNVPVHHEVTLTYELVDDRLVLVDEDRQAGICHHCPVPTCWVVENSE